MKNVMSVLVLIGTLMLVLVSAGCTDWGWDSFWDMDTGAENVSPEPNGPDGLVPDATVGEAATSGDAEEEGKDMGVGSTPMGTVPGDSTPVAPATPTKSLPPPTTSDGDNGDVGAGSFSIQYTPPDGYTAAEGETLAMVFTIVPEGGFDDEVRVTLDLAVPDPVFGVFPLWSETYDMGTHTPPYPPITQTLALDPDNPPEEYAWITDVYDTARSAGISEIDVNVHVSATGGGITVEERPVYHVRLA